MHNRTGRTAVRAAHPPSRYTRNAAVRQTGAPFPDTQDFLAEQFYAEDGRGMLRKL